MPLPTPSLPEDNARHFDPAPRELVGGAVPLVPPAFFDDEGVEYPMRRKLRVLVACEFSATVRDAFRARGHNAWSCDLLPTEGDSAWHVQDSVLHLLARDPWWDLVIAHPPCTFLTYAGAKHLYIGGRKENGRDEPRWAAMRDAAEFFRTFLALPCPVAIENPIMLAAAKEIVGRNYDQTFQPWQFGHGEVKRTCLWLKDLPPLRPTHSNDGCLLTAKAPAERIPRVHHAAPGPNRWKERSRTLPGIANAMADQWGDYLLARTMPFVPDDAELGGDLPEYTPGGFPDGNAFPGAIDLSFHASGVANA